MELEDERVIQLIFPEGLPGDIENHADFNDYLYKLGGYKVDQLRKEQIRLGDENKQVIEQTQDIAISNYKTFIQTSECSRQIYTEFGDAGKRLDILLGKLPQLPTKCDNFILASREINDARRLNTLTMKKNEQLLEILEMPQLMDTCIRHERYEEALELAAHVQRMSTKYGEIPVIAGIGKTIESSWHIMLTQLLAELKTDLQLPKCLQVIGYLKRMQAFSEVELKLKFLQMRDIWLKDVLAEIPTVDPQQHLTKTIELTRINLFNIITQYRAIFVDIETPAGPVKELSVGDSNRIFHSWLNDKVDEFLHTLEVDLAQGISSLETILGQCMYFGLSFSRVGADFRGLMASIFASTICKKFTNSIFKATKQFEHEIENFTLINRSTAIIKRGKASDLDKTESNQPPDTLLDFQPLALYCNNVLNAFNELRLCAPIAIADSVTRTLQTSLENVCRNILIFYRQEQQAFSAVERENFVKLCSCFAYDLLPYIQRCIHFVFPPNILAMNLGINVLNLQKDKLTYIQQKKILEPIDYLLPDKIAATEVKVKEEGMHTEEEN